MLLNLSLALLYQTLYLQPCLDCLWLSLGTGPRFSLWFLNCGIFPTEMIMWLIGCNFCKWLNVLGKKSQNRFIRYIENAFMIMAHSFALISRVSRTQRRLGRHLSHRPYHYLRRHLGGWQTLQEFSPLKKQASAQNVYWKLEKNVQGHPKEYFRKMSVRMEGSLKISKVFA